jgi:hypothetical protein
MRFAEFFISTNNRNVKFCLHEKYQITRSPTFKASMKVCENKFHIILKLGTLRVAPQIKMNLDRQCTCKVTFWCYRAGMVTAEKR